MKPGDRVGLSAIAIQRCHWPINSRRYRNTDPDEIRGTIIGSRDGQTRVRWDRYKGVETIMQWSLVVIPGEPEAQP